MRGKSMPAKITRKMPSVASMRPPLNAGEILDAAWGLIGAEEASMRPPLNAGEIKLISRESTARYSFNEAPAECGGNR